MPILTEKKNPKPVLQRPQKPSKDSKLNKTSVKNKSPRICRNGKEPSSGNGHSYENSKGPSLGSFREQKGISQRDLAQKLNIPRSSLQRFETVELKHISVGFFQNFLYALGFDLNEFVKNITDLWKQPSLIRIPAEKNSMTLDLRQGVQINVLLPGTMDYFVGKMTIDARRELSSAQAPRGKFLFFYILEGTLLITYQGKEHVFKKGECCLLQEPIGYDLCNPEMLQKASALIFCAPSFLQYNS